METKYDIVKNKMQTENFTSRTIEGIQQDFYACMYLTNIAATTVAIDAQFEIDEAREGKDNKYQYQANINELIGVLKDRFVMALTENSVRKQERSIKKILNEVKISVVPKCNNRSIPRKKTKKY